MKQLVSPFAVACAVLAGMCGRADAQLATQVAGVDLRLSGAVSGQIGTYKDVDTGIEKTDEEVDASAILNIERISDAGLAIGARLEFDTGDRQVEDLERDEIYLYMAGGFGRIELGEQDGPADTISLHAPVIGLGQIRGDFARYTGTPALLSAFDTRDDLKIVYLSAPVRGFRWGVSYAPTVESNTSAVNPRSRTQQENAYEVAAAYQVPLGPMALGVSAAYVGASADPITERGDIASWSIGTELRGERLAIGAAYVDRGESNSLTPDLDETEWNAGVSWVSGPLGVAASGAVTESRVMENRLVGVGAYYELSSWIIVRADAVSIDERFPTGRSADGYAGIVELSFRVQ